MRESGYYESKVIMRVGIWVFGYLGIESGNLGIESGNLGIWVLGVGIWVFGYRE